MTNCFNKIALLIIRENKTKFLYTAQLLQFCYFVDVNNCYVAGPAHGQGTKARRHGMSPEHGVFASEQRKRAKVFVFVSLM